VEGSCEEVAMNPDFAELRHPPWPGTIGTLALLAVSESKRGYRRAGIALLALFLLIAGAFTYLGAPPVAGVWDEMVLLDAGWRIVNGQVQHTDFHVPAGALPHLLVAFGMKVAAASTSSITYGIVLLLALTLPTAWYIAARRLPWVICFVLVLFEGFYLVSPRPPGYPIRGTSYAMIYNREAYFFFSVALLCIFLKPRESAKPRWELEGIIAGILLGLMLYCKLSYFLAAAGLSLVGAVLYPRPWRWLLGLIASLATVCTAFWLFFRINLFSYLQDLRVALGSESVEMRLKLFSQGIATNVSWICLLILCLGFWTWAGRRQGITWAPTLRAWIVAASIVAASLSIIAGNSSQGGGKDDPLYFVAAMICLELFRRQTMNELPPPGIARWAILTSLILLVLICCGPILLRDVASCAYTVRWDFESRPSYPPSRLLHSARLKDFYVPAETEHATAYWLARDHPERINDGIDLLQRNLQNGDRLTTIAYANPFSFALGLKPARDYFLWWDINMDFSLTHHPSAQEFLGDSTLVMVPRLTDRAHGCCFADTDVPLELYGSYLREHFHEIASTDVWTLYRRTSQYKRELGSTAVGQEPSQTLLEAERMCPILQIGQHRPLCLVLPPLIIETSFDREPNPIVHVSY
jgi:hypothetical protein